MTPFVPEEELLRIIDPYIRNHCRFRWRSMEYDDRLSEARLIFISVLRNKNIPEERVWNVFCRTLDLYMKPLNSIEARHRYCRSLDAPLRRRDGEEGSTLLELIAASDE